MLPHLIPPRHCLLLTTVCSSEFITVPDLNPDQPLKNEGRNHINLPLKCPEWFLTVSSSMVVRLK